MDQYISFVEALRFTHRSLAVTPEVVVHVIGYLTSLDQLRSCPLLQYVFSLSCLCLTEIGTAFHTVKFGKVDSSKLSCGVTDVIFPVQSYLSVVPDSVSVCTSDAALVRFASVVSEFGDDGFPDTYDPWSSVDHFGRWDLFQKLQKAFNGPSGSPTVRSPKKGSNTSSVLSASKTASVKVSGPSSGLTACAKDAIVADLQECGSKP